MNVDWSTAVLLITKCELGPWGIGQNLKVQVAKKNLKDILNNVESNYKVQAAATFFDFSFHLWNMPKKLILWNKGPNKESVLCKKVLECVFWFFQGSKKFEFFWDILWKKKYFINSQPKIYLLFGILDDFSQKQPLRSILEGGQNPPPFYVKLVKLQPM